jgi:peroxiredoxin Q/BCP
VKEACRFRDMAAEFARFGAQPVGISGDAVRRQQSFVNTHSLGYPLLSDRDGTIRERFHIIRGYAPDFAPPWAKFRRNTYLIGRDGRLLDVIRSDLRPSVHADLALEYFRQRSR